MGRLAWPCGTALLAALALAILGSSIAEAVVISVTNNQGVGATLGLDPTKTYTHRLDFPGDNATTAVNGVQFGTVNFGFGTDLFTGKPFGVTTPTPLTWGAGNTSVITDFSYNNAGVAGSIEMVTLGGLTVGTRYDARFYYDGNWPGRPQTVTVSAGGALYTGTFDQLAGFPQNYLSVIFQADTPTLAVAFSQNTAGSWHQHAITNEVVPVAPMGLPRYPITDLFNTGVVTDDNGGLNATLAAIGAGDPHWIFYSGPQNPPPNTPATVQTNHPAWTANDPNSRWIGVSASGANNVTQGTYRYQTIFTIPPEYDPTTALITGVWYTDDAGPNTKIFLNGVDTLINGGGPFNSGSVFSILDNVNNSGAHFQVGSNYLDFYVLNGGGGANPHGLRIDQLAGTFQQAVPEPATLSILALGGLGLLARRRRRARQAGRGARLGLPGALVLFAALVFAPAAHGALIAYWSFDNTLNNTPNGYATTTNGGWGYSTNVPWTTGGGASLNLNGTDARAMVTSPPTVSGTFTVSAWARVGDTAARSIVGTRAPSDTSFDMKFDVSGSQRVHGDIGNGSGGWYTTGADISPFLYATNRWYHMTYVVTPSNYSIYMHDGSGSLLDSRVNVGIGPGTPLFSNATHQIAIGAYQVGGGENFLGQIDEVRIYDNALTQQQVQALAVGAAPTGGTGPGGFERTNLSSSLLYWLRADQGVTQSSGAVSAWNDQTVNARNFSQSTGTQQPTYQGTGLGGNNMPAVRFDGSDDRLTLSTATAPQTVFAVTKVNTYNSLGGIWGTDGSPSDKGIRNNSATNYRGPSQSEDNNDFPYINNSTTGNIRVNGAVTTAYSVGTPHILSELRGVNFNATTFSNTQIGGYYSGRYYNGDVGEVIVYDRVLNSAERQIVENYLSAKYDIPLAAGNVYTGDDPGKGNYDFEVFGIGRVNAANQLVSAGTGGLGIQAANGTLGDNEWVLAGRDTPVGGTPRPVWYIDKTNVNGIDITLTFDFSDAGMIGAPDPLTSLIYSASGTPATFTAVGGAGTVNGDAITFSLADASFQSGYYTLAAVPEPATITLLALGGLGLLARRRPRRSRRGVWLAMFLIATMAVPGQAGVLTFSPALTTDAASGINTGVAYSHAVSGGQTATVNGVSFANLDPATTPPKTNWNTWSWTKNEVENNNNNWNPATGGVTGTGLQELFGDFCYSGNGTNPGNYQTFTLGGLVPGTTYDTRVYVRPWDVAYTGRLIALKFTNGAEIDTQSISEDQPTAQGYPSNHNAYYINYRFTAQTSSLTLDATVNPGGGGSFHMYGMTNQFITPPTGGTGPGGLEATGNNSSLLYWLRADKGVTTGGTFTWADQTARGNNFTQGTGANQPQYVAGALNGQPVIRFDGSNDQLTLATATAPQTVFIVNNPDQYVWLAGIWGCDNPSDKGIRLADLPAQPAWRNPGDANDFHNPAGPMYINGTATNNFTAYGTAHILTDYRGTSSPATYNNTRLGWYYPGRLYDGDIAEVVVYDRVLNSAERQIVENALSAKYNVALSAGNVYRGDDPVTPIGGPGNYDLDVFGIGRVNAANQVLAAGAAGLGIMALNGTLGDGEWLLAGHRVPVNSEANLRWARDWYLDKLGSVDVMLTFDRSDAGLPGSVYDMLLYSADGSAFTPLAIQGTVSGDQVSFTVPDSLLLSGYYTLGAVPEPATLTLLGLGALGLLARRRARRAGRSPHAIVVGLPALILCSFLGTAPADVLYSDDFSGLASADLNGTTPDTGWPGWKWAASTNWRADGSNSVGTSANAWLRFTPAAGNVYTLSLDVNPKISGSDDWFALGYSASNATTNIFQTSPNSTIGWMLNRENDASASAVQTFLGPDTNNGASHDFTPDKVGWVNMKVVLNTQPANWTAEWFVDNVSIRAPVAFGTNPTVNYVGFGAYNSATGSVDNFSLTSLNPSPPPPASLVTNTQVVNGPFPGGPFAVSATDLLNGLVPTVNDMNLIRTEEGVTTNDPAALTNGAFGNASRPPSPASEIVAIHTNAVLTYTLDTLASPAGYAITEIDTYAGWQDNGRDAQQYNILYSLVADPDTFLPLATANLATPGYGDAQSTAVQFLMNDGSPLISGIAALRFEFPIVQNGYVGYREIDVFGEAMTVVPEPTSLTLLGLGALGLLARRRRARR